MKVHKIGRLEWKDDRLICSGWHMEHEDSDPLDTVECLTRFMNKRILLADKAISTLRSLPPSPEIDALLSEWDAGS